MWVPGLSTRQINPRPRYQDVNRNSRFDEADQPIMERASI